MTMGFLVGLSLENQTWLQDYQTKAKEGIAHVMPIIQSLWPQVMTILNRVMSLLVSAAKSTLNMTIVLLDRVVSILGPLTKSAMTLIIVLVIAASTVGLFLFHPLLLYLGKAIRDDVRSQTPLARPYSRTSRAVRKIDRIFDFDDPM